MGAVISFLVIAIVVLLILSSCIRIVPQAQALVVERLGAYLETWSVGVHFKVPFIDRVAKRVILKEQVVDFAPQPVITKDNVTMKIDTVVFFQITDPKLFAYGVENPIMAIENLTATTLRNIIGDLELDQTLTSRETINTKMRAALDVATDPWGIKVNRVELKNIIPPAAIQDAMEKQMKAERERRESILRAEGEKKSTILVAEGKKESAILEAEAEKEAAILRAEAEKEKMIREAEGEAEAILKVQKAEADGLRFIKEAGADNAVLQLKSLAQILHLPSASIGRELLELEKTGLLVKVQNKGRILTPQGERFLEEERSRREKMKAANELIEAASMETESGLEDILLVRKLLEGYAAEACAERIEPKELQKLKDLQADYLYAIRHGRAGSEEDLALHLKIAHLSGSPSILRMLKLILTDQDAYARFNQAAVRSDEVRENEHESLLAAIEAGDGALARREMERHLEHVGENLQAYFAGRK